MTNTPDAAAVVESNELKPCPFCGTEPTVSDEGAIYCPAGAHNCPIASWEMDREDWQRRPNASQAAAVIERYGEALHDLEWIISEIQMYEIRKDMAGALAKIKETLEETKP